jgi:feruloyl esterase
MRGGREKASKEHRVTTRNMPLFHVTGLPALVLGLLGAMTVLATAAPAAAQTDTACQAIGVGRKIGNAVVLLTESKAAAADVPAYCRVVAVAMPARGSNIVIESWLPARAGWNGKVLANGSGGFAGSVTAVMNGFAIRFGYAAASTDMGTYPSGVGFNGGAGRPEVVKDFGYRATHEMAVLLKALAQRYYGQLATHSYYAGCSTGGQQGLMSAQRYPEDFDGIIAGAPAHNRTHLHIMFNQRSTAARDPSTRLSPAQRTLWAKEVSKECLPGNVTAPGDTYMASPTQCRASPRKLLCKAGQDQATCLSEPQVRTLETLYDGLRNPRTGELISPAFPRGIEGQLGTFLGSSGEFDMTRWVFGPDWDINSFDYDKDVDRMDAKLASITNAMNPDLSRFAARGGKLILFHGLEDTAISPLDTLDYYDRITAKGHSKADFTRLYLAPGVGHCAGGRGPGAFGQLPLTMTGDPTTDMVTALDHWVTKSVAPAMINATPTLGKPDAPGSRPLCPYPEVARYDGRGDVMKSASYTCTAAAPLKYEPIAARYRK